jgi:hypothetical protein
MGKLWLPGDAFDTEPKQERPLVGNPLVTASVWTGIAEGTAISSAAEAATLAREQVQKANALLDSVAVTTDNAQTIESLRERLRVVLAKLG